MSESLDLGETMLGHRQVRGGIRRLYISHFLSTWNSNLFEYGAVLFLAVIIPGTLLYASIYALVSSLAAIVLATSIGNYIDRTNRLECIRLSIILQRGSVAASCLIFAALMMYDFESLAMFPILFGLLLVLACTEKVGFILNSVSVERDWIPIIASGLNYDRGTLNATMRRIDLTCKLISPVVVSFIQTFSTMGALMTVLCLTLASMSIEYIAIVQVYHLVPGLAMRNPNVPGLGTSNRIEEYERRENERRAESSSLSMWISYVKSPAFLPSFALSLLYLTVLCTGVQWQTYMLASGHSALVLSIIRLAAVFSELSATIVTPWLTPKVGVVRAGLWLINWQVFCLVLGLAAYFEVSDLYTSSWFLTIGIIFSRVGLYGFDLSAQDIIQETVPEHQRGKFSACEVGVQNAFLVLSYISTIIFPRADEFEYPAMISFGAVLLASIFYAVYVRAERGHLIHMSPCLKYDAARDVI